MKHLFTDIMGDLIFSDRWNVQTSASKRWILSLLPQGTAGLHAAGHIVSIVKMGLADFVLPKLMQDVRRFLELSRTQCKERIMKKEEQNSRRDVFSSILQASSLQHGIDASTRYDFGINDLVAEAGFLMNAGGDTTATTVTATLFYLLSHPSILERVQEEVEVAFSEGTGQTHVKSADIGKLNQTCRLLCACIEESLRLSPPVGGLMPRETLPGGLSISQKWVVPAGIDVGVPVYALHHDEKIWKDANKFKPERWLQDDSKELHAAFMPFGSGRASCLGKELAYMEAMLVIAGILGRYELQMIPMSQKESATAKLAGAGSKKWGRGNKEEFQARDVFTSDHVGPLVLLRLRQQRV